jgi:hypothetical protein
MRKLVLYIVISLPGLQLMARQSNSSDSVYYYDQTNRQMEWAHTGSTHLLFSNYKNIARSQLYAGREQGSFRRAQEAYRQTTAGFHTDGIKTSGRFTVAGRFDFEKRWDDSLGWWNGGEYKEEQPYYFFAGKAAKYEKQLFNLAATVTYNLWKNKLYIGSGASYRYHWTTRSVDPRPDVKEFYTLFRPEIAGRLGKHIAGTGFIWGRGNEVDRIAYKNSTYNGSPAYIERNNFMSLGFGHIAHMDRYLQHFNETRGFFAHYATAFKNWQLQAGGEYQLFQEDIDKDSLATRSDHGLYAFLQQDKTSGNLLITHTAGKNSRQMELKFTTQSMLNWASEFQATSYQYTATNASITYRQLWQKNNGIGIEVGAGCHYKDQYKEDIVAAHKHQLKVITPHIYAGIYRRAANKSSLAFNLTPSFIHALTNDLSVPVSQEKYFTYGVVYPDYLYWQKNSLGLTTQFKFIQKEKPKRHRLGCTVNLKWQQATDGAHTELPALYIPSGNRWSAGASLNLYL